MAEDDECREPAALRRVSKYEDMCGSRQHPTKSALPPHNSGGLKVHINEDTLNSRLRRLALLVSDGLALVFEILKNNSDRPKERYHLRHCCQASGLICDRPVSLWERKELLFA